MAWVGWANHSTRLNLGLRTELRTDMEMDALNPSLGTLEGWADSC